MNRRKNPGISLIFNLEIFGDSEETKGIYILMETPFAANGSCQAACRVYLGPRKLSKENYPIVPFKPNEILRQLINEPNGIQIEYQH